MNVEPTEKFATARENTLIVVIASGVLRHKPTQARVALPLNETRDKDVLKVVVFA